MSNDEKFPTLLLIKKVSKKVIVFDDNSAMCYLHMKNGTIISGSSLIGRTPTDDLSDCNENERYAFGHAFGKAYEMELYHMRQKEYDAGVE
jgi:hypothetical protein